MKFNNTKKQEKGSLIIEALAVLGLIALLTPLLFQQISRRNEEISNANIATEIRSIKNALSAYIQANEYSLSETLGLIDHDNYKEISADNPQSTENVSLNTLQSYGFSLSNIPSDEYTILIQGYTLPVEYTFLEGEGISLGTKYRPVIYGIVLGKTGYSLRRAGKIASLIGLDGGVMLNGGVFQGVDGAWSFETEDNAGFPAGAVGAVTIFDVATNSAILEGVKIKDYIGKTVQTTSGAIRKLHVPNFFAVGDASNCIKKYKNPDFSINDPEEEGYEGCAPLFEVYENTENGEFFVKMREGRIETRKVAFSNSDTEGDETTLRVPSQGSPYALYNFMGTINTEGTQNYLLDPAYTSVMNDIRLTSRGGARLSEVLPDYINKGIYFIPREEPIDTPQCPIGYAPAVAIIPIRANATYSFNEDNFKVEQGKIKRDESSNEEDITVEHGSVWINYNSTSSNYTSSINSSTITIALCKPGSSTTSCSFDLSATALVYTYCVYDKVITPNTTTRSNTSTSTVTSTN